MQQQIMTFSEVTSSSTSSLSDFVRSRLLASLCASIVAIVVTGCGGGGYGSNSGSSSGGGCGGVYGSSCPPMSTGAPSVDLTVPNLTPNRSMTLTATPTAPNGVARVDFLIDGTIVGSATAAPYTTSWDTSTSADGTHGIVARVMDSMGLAASSATTTVTVANVITLNPALASSEETTKPASTATGAGTFTINLLTGALSGQVTVTGMTPTAAHIHDAYAGNDGAIIIPFTQNVGNANRFDVPTGTLLTQAQVDKLLAGALYVNVHSDAFRSGEIRAQLKPTNVKVVFAALTGAQEVPPVTINAAATAAVTVDSAANTVSVHVNSTGVDDATMAHIHKAASGANGLILVTFVKDATVVGHWSIEKQAITSSDVADFNAGLWYVNMHTPAFQSGAIRGQIVAPATLTQLQTAIFSTRCASCHNGVGTALPGVMNLTTAATSYAALVGVASLEQSALKRVKVNDAINSYVTQKLEGASTITGERMPRGGPYLDQPTIEQVKSWIDNGALNN